MIIHEIFFRAIILLLRIYSWYYNHINKQNPNISFRTRSIFWTSMRVRMRHTGKVYETEYKIIRYEAAFHLVYVGKLRNINSLREEYGTEQKKVRFFFAQVYTHLRKIIITQSLIISYGFIN
eukprot:snap_masked-scaffold_25-processed-gene-2.33-mRNA-1 protein AED:1.00 eAED:1.00 QI:0/0/0/0/1/1/2/0/121